ncbi:MAG: hypothetical protein FWG66_07590 [Spirochaetes bacterium]|nr:hypothetical protein [Spirochaetota bacterium]
MENADHNKIIKAIATKLFKPHGIKRKGQSRLFIDDNGWFIIIIEFQPHNYNRGAFLNIGINFNWYLNDYFSFDIGGREKDFIEYKNTDQFTAEIKKICEYSIEKINGYRSQFKNIKDAEKIILKTQYTSDDFWGNYHRGIISGLVGNMDNLKKYFEKILNEPDDNIGWRIELKKNIKELKALAEKDSSNFNEKIKGIIKEARKRKNLDEKEIII